MKILLEKCFIVCKIIINGRNEKMLEQKNATKYHFRFVFSIAIVKKIHKKLCLLDDEFKLS